MIIRSLSRNIYWMCIMCTMLSTDNIVLEKNRRQSCPYGPYSFMGELEINNQLVSIQFYH